MSDTMQAPVGGDLEPSGDGSGGNRRATDSTCCCAGALLIGAAVYFLFLSGDSGSDEFAAVPQARPREPMTRRQTTATMATTAMPVKRSPRSSRAMSDAIRSLRWPLS